MSDESTHSVPQPPEDAAPQAEPLEALPFTSEIETGPTPPAAKPTDDIESLRAALGDIAQRVYVLQRVVDTYLSESAATSTDPALAGKLRAILNSTPAA